MNWLRALATVGGLTAVSRIAGFIRDVALAASLGAGVEADALFIALRPPDLLRRLMTEGAVSHAVVPVFTRWTAAGRGEAAMTLVTMILVVITLAAMILTVVMALTAPWWLTALVGDGDAGRFDLAVGLTRWTSLYLAPMAVLSVLGALAVALGRVAAFAAAPIILNLVILAALGLAHVGGVAPAWMVAMALPVAGAFQAAWLAGAVWRAGARPTGGLARPMPEVMPEVWRCLARIGPAALAGGAGQITFTVAVALVSAVEGAVSALAYADRLIQLPLGAIGLAIGMVALPRLVAEEAALATFARAALAAWALALPAAIGLAVAAHPIVTTLFQRGAFDADDAALTATALMALAPTIPAGALSKTLNARQFAGGDTRRAVWAAVAAIIAAAVATTSLVGPFGLAGAAAAVSVGAWVNVVAPLMVDRDARRALSGVGLALGWVTLSAGLMGVATAWLVAGVAANALGLAVIVGGGLVAYLACLGLGWSLWRNQIGWDQLRKTDQSPPR